MVNAASGQDELSGRIQRGLQKRLGRPRNGNPVIVTTRYRYRRPPRKKKAVALEVPAIVTKRAAEPARQVAPLPADEDRKSASVTARKPGRRAVADVPDMTPEEHKRRGDAADALFREIKRQIATKDRP